MLRFGLVLVLLAATPAALAAQSPGAANASTDATLAQTLTAAPIPGQTGISVTGGGTLMEGRTETKGWTLDGIVSYTTSKRLLMRFEAQAAHTDYRLAPGQPYLTIENHQLATALFLKPVRKRFSLLSIGGWARDELLQLEHRAWVEAGLGIHLVDLPKVNFLVAPLFAVGAEHRTFTDTASGVSDFGVLQTFTLKLNPKFVFEEFLAMHADVTHSGDSSSIWNVSAISEVAPHFNLKVYYQYNYAELVPQGQDPLQTTIGLALQVLFMKAPAPPGGAPTAPPGKD